MTNLQAALHRAATGEYPDLNDGALISDAYHQAMRNMRETWEAMQTMRNSINEIVPMPSLESDLLQGPENSIFCAAVAQAVADYVNNLQGANQRLAKALGIAQREAEQYAGRLMDETRRADEAEAALQAARTREGDAMTVLEAIDRIIEEVEAGTLGGLKVLGCPIPYVDAMKAYNGDLNAAKNLHEVLLPGWDALLDLRSDVTVSNGAKNLIGYRDYFGKADGNPARAWLLAILRAHRHQIAAGGE